MSRHLTASVLLWASVASPTRAADVAVVASISNTSFKIKPIWSSNIFWDWHDWLQGPLPDGTLDQFPFLREIELFTATGGCYAGYHDPISNQTCGSLSRDLFVDPAIGPASGYNFTLWLEAVGNIVASGLNVYVVTANVPVSMSSQPVLGGFQFNSAPPSNMTAYRDYLNALATAAVTKFGLPTVRNWKWGVFTEFNNQDWLNVTSDVYMQVYDFTACALEDALGRGNVRIGGHACTQCQPDKAGGGGGRAWNATDLLIHVVNGTNACTGGVGAPMTFMSDSFYETRPGVPGDLSWFAPEVDQLLNQARELGMLSQLETGIDEGRILSGPTSEGPFVPINTRAIGNTYQATFDALLYNLMVKRNMSWYARWGVNTDGPDGMWTWNFSTPQAVDNAAGNLARLTTALTNQELLSSSNGTELSTDGSIVDSVVSWLQISDEKPAHSHVTIFGSRDHESLHSAIGSGGNASGILSFLAFNHFDQLNSTGPDKLVSFSVCGFQPAPTAQTPLIGYLTRLDNENGQFWNQWWDDKTAKNITKLNGGWSAYGDEVSFDLPADREYWLSQVPTYQGLAALQSNAYGNANLNTNGCVEFEIEISCHGVALVQLPVPAGP